MSNLIINIEGIDFEKSNITFVNGLTMERVRIYYPWLLNAKVVDPIIGEDDYGLVWYFGDWVCGEWEDGTWYSGDFYQGNWNNGKWFSYKLNKFDVVNEKLIILNTNKDNSKFHNGIWVDGVWKNGIFGSDIIEDWTGFELYTYTNTDYLELINVPNYKRLLEEKNVATWLSGEWKNGLFKNGVWANGVWANGDFLNSIWVDGKFYDGIIDGYAWHNGFWYNGDFIKGKWYNGIFTKLDKNKLSRFGAFTEYEDHIVCEWKDGEWKDGDWFSGFQIKDGVEKSFNNKMSIWENGKWKNGVFNGGHFKRGEWFNGSWKDGIFGNIEESTWVKPKYVYENTLPYENNNYNTLSNFWSGSGETGLEYIESANLSGFGYIDSSVSDEYTLDYVENITSNLLQITGHTSTSNEVYIRNHKIGFSSENGPKVHINMITPIDLISENVYAMTGTTLENGYLDKSRNFKLCGSTFDVIQLYDLPPISPCFNFWFKVDVPLFSYQVIFESDNLKISHQGGKMIQIISGSTTTYYDLDINDMCWHHMQIYDKEEVALNVFIYIFIDGVEVGQQPGDLGILEPTATLSSHISGLTNTNIEDFQIFDVKKSTWHNRRFINHKRDFTNDLKSGMIIKIGSSYKVVTSAEYDPSIYFKISVGVGNTILHSWTKVTLTDSVTISNDVSFKYKQKINNEKSGYCIGNNCNSILDDGDYITLRFDSGQPETIDNEFIYIKEYNLSTRIINTYSSYEFGVYYTIAITRTKIGEIPDYVEDTPIDLLDYYHYQEMKKSFISKSLIFHGIDQLDISDIKNVVNLQVNFDKKININNFIYRDDGNAAENWEDNERRNFNQVHGEIKDNSIGLPFYFLTYPDSTSTPLLYDYPYYDDRYGNEQIENSSKYKLSEITNIDYEKYTYALNSDLWGLEHLKDFYIPPTYSLPIYSPDNYDITNPNTIKERLRIETSFKINYNGTDAIMNKTISITQPLLKVHYMSYSSATWHNGDFEKGLWINGDFNGGNMYSCIFFDGNFENGYLGYEVDKNRQNDDDDDKKSIITSFSL